MMIRSLTFLSLFLLGAQLATLGGWLAVVLPSTRDSLLALAAVGIVIYALAWLLDDALISALRVKPAGYYAVLLAILGASLCGLGVALWMVL
jgi:hypothetical protein